MVLSISQAEPVGQAQRYASAPPSITRGRSWQHASNARQGWAVAPTRVPVFPPSTCSSSNVVIAVGKPAACGVRSWMEQRLCHVVRGGVIAPAFASRDAGRGPIVLRCEPFLTMTVPPT